MQSGSARALPLSSCKTIRLESLLVCRLTLLTYSGKVFVHFTFNDLQFGNNSAIIRHLNALTPIKGTTSTHQALQVVYGMIIQEPSENNRASLNFTRNEILLVAEARKNVQKLVVLITGEF